MIQIYLPPMFAGKLQFFSQNIRKGFIQFVWGCCVVTNISGASGVQGVVVIANHSLTDVA
jgi:hypothetical protein